MRTLFTLANRIIIVLLLATNFSFAQTIKLEQGQNGSVDGDPISPVNWAAGNSNSGNSHFFEGQSIPYRMTISKLRAGAHTVEIEWDTRVSGKNAIDYITSFNRICEIVIPASGVPNFGSIPAPNGTPQPSASFNQLSEADKKIAIYGGTINEIKYVQQDDISGTTGITRLSISFTAIGGNGPSNTVIFAWGGHVASALDWGVNNSASSISGSPYHTRVISLDGKSYGGQDRSVQATSEVIDLDIECHIKGEIELCASTSASYSVPTGAFSYLWSVTDGGEIVSGQGTNVITVNWTASGSVSVAIDNVGACLPTNCSLDVTLITPPVLSVVEAVLCSTENGGITAIANLNDFASVSFGDLIFTRNGTVIETPESILVTNQDVIEVTAVGGCGSSETFTVTVNDRQIFGICSQGKVYEPIGSELKALYEIFRRGQTVESNEVFYISGNEVLIEVIYFKDKFAEVKTVLENLGFVTPTEEELKQDPTSLIIAGFFPIENLLELNQHYEIINYVRPAIPGVPNKGATTTQGDRVMRSNLVRAGYVHSEGDQAIDGTGIKIGLLSDSYATRTDAGVNPLATDIANGDLPENLYFSRDLPSRFGIGTDEGRAMLQIIHDIAPGAQLGFRTGVITAGDFAQGIRDLASAGSDIIIDDITYITEPFFSDGKVAKAVNEVSNNGVSYFTSAGNFGSKSFEGIFNPVQDPTIYLPLNGGEWTDGGRAHQFGDGKTTQSIKVFPGQNGPAVYMIALQWDDPLYSVDQTGSLYDLDIYLKDFGAPLFGFNRDNSNGDPIEILSFTITEETTIDLLIARECESCTDLDSNKGIKFKYVVFRGELDPNDQNGINASTIVGHANSEGAMTVGAVLYANTSVFGFDPSLVPAGTAPFTAATFSSRGGTMTNNLVRNKPDFTAPNGVNTTVNLGAPNLEGDNFPNFFGTSAAAPHAAAVAALIKQARLKYYPSTKPTGWLGDPGESLPADIRRVLKTTAQDMHESGDDIKSGSGLVRADRALLELAAPNPDNIELVYDEALTPGEVEFKLIINGTNLYEGSNVYLRDELLSSTYKIDDEGFGYLEVTVPLFEGNPGVTVVNNAISDSGLDGGTAGPVYFFNINKKTIAIRADDQTKKFAQVLDPFTASVYERVDNNWVLSALTLEEVGLTLNPDNANTSLVPLTLTSSISGDLAEVGTYVITASHPQLGLTFTDFFNYVGVAQEDGNLLYDGINNSFGNYGPGIITVESLPITIKPIDLTGESSLTYGESISDALKFEVIIPEDLIQLDGKVKIADVQSLKDAILAQYLGDLALAKQPDDTSLPLGIFNGRTILDKASFINKSFMVSARTMLNARVMINARTILNSRPIINSAFDVPTASFIDYLDNSENQELKSVSINSRTMINARTILNARTIVNSRTIINGRTIINARTMLNGKTIINSRTIINSTGIEGEAEDNSLVIFGENDLELAAEGENETLGKYYDFGEEIGENDDDFNLEFFSVNTVTGSDVGEHFIIPGTFESRNFIVSYLPADLTITPAILTANTSAIPDMIGFGDTAPKFVTEFGGFEVSTSFLDPEGIEVILDDDAASIIDSVEYSLLKDATSFPASGVISAGNYEVDPIITLFQPTNYSVGTINRGPLTVNKATPTVSVTGGLFEFDGGPMEATAVVYGIGGEEDLLDPTLLTFIYQGTGDTNYPATATAPAYPGTYSVIANFAGNENYNPASSESGSLVIVGCINEAPVLGEFNTAKGSGNTSNPAIIKKPANTQIGDLLIVGLMFEKGESPSVTPPDKNWIRIERVNQLNQIAMVTYYKVVKSNKEPETYGFRISQSPKWTMGITRVSGADIDHPEGPIVTFSAASGGSAIEATAPSLTTVDCNTLVMLFYSNKKNTTWTAPAGTIEVYDDPNDQQGLTSNMMSYFIQSDAGETGDLTAVASLGENWVAQAIAIRPRKINLESARINPLTSETVTELSLSEGVSTLEGKEVPGELKAYPNPVRDRLNLSLKGLVEEVPSESSLVISDALGRNLPWNGTWHEKERRLELDFSHVNVGVYIINVQTLYGVKSIRVIKK
ncbi:MAG: S8 family serine peptidase [Algoriphagus sp.]|nr:S8 family serine peptidase [Algoriphagus sp.]